MSDLVDVKNLRIVFFLNILRDGAGMVNRELGFAEELIKAGAQVTILSFFKPDFYPAIEGLQVEQVFPIKYYDFLYETPLGTLGGWVPVRRALKRLNPDVVFTDLPHEAAWALRFRSALNYRVILTYHGVANSALYTGDVARALDHARTANHKQMKQVDQVIVVSDFLLKETDRIGVDATRIYNGVDCRVFNPERKLNNVQCTGPVALFIGRYTECKGALYVIEAFHKTLEVVPDAELIMYGYFESDDYTRQMKEYIQQHGLEQKVHLFGPLDGREMAYHINRCSIFVNGSINESFGMPLLEAQACGVPCLAFGVEGIPEVVMDKETGYLSPANDVETMSAQMTELFTNESLRRRFGDAALKHAKTYQYSWLKASLFEVLEKVMKGASV